MMVTYGKIALDIIFSSLQRDGLSLVPHLLATRKPAQRLGEQRAAGEASLGTRHARKTAAPPCSLVIRDESPSKA